jgi:hypothetical protein
MRYNSWDMDSGPPDYVRFIDECMLTLWEFLLCSRTWHLRSLNKDSGRCRC